jgi:hypothetical protein
MEIVFELAESAVNAQQILAKATKSGMNFRMSVIEGELYAALGELRAAGAKIVSVTQIKPTLEDYFLELAGQDRVPSRGDRGQRKMSRILIVARNTFARRCDRVLYNGAFSRC